jgi:cell wall-associated protease
MKASVLSLLLLLSAPVAKASVVAIIDSGTDYLHKDLTRQMWTNANEVEANNRDEDLNGYVDDFYGWNFAENNHKVIDYAYLGTLDHDIRKFFEIQGKMMKGTATQAEIDWARTMIQDQEFIKKISIYGNFMHGTHVAGIAAKGNLDSQILAVKLIPTEVKLPFSIIKELDKLKKLKSGNQENARMWLLKQGLGLLAGQQMVLLTEIARYVGSHKADIANGSFGTGFAQAKMIVGALAKTVLGRDATEQEIEELSIFFLDKLVEEGKKMVMEAEDTLFVWAAGNDGTDNDKYPTSPANIKSNNSITVAASFGTAELARFSNYGVQMVDVAAPGVTINSTVPGNEYLEVSGTSQAAPLVANIAAQIKDANPELLPKQIKDIIMSTVDKKSWLGTKVKSGGVVNNNRAVKAGVLSNTMKLSDAIAQAQKVVKDLPTMKSVSRQGDSSLVLPLPGMFKVK